MGPKRYFTGAVALCVALAAMSAAATGDPAVTWSTIAQRAAFPVYRPLQTLGLRFDGVKLARYTGCLTAGWGSPGSYAGPHFGIYEPGDSSRCGQPGVASQVATTSINGVNLEVLVQCAAWPKCTIKDGETNGSFLLFVPEHVSKHYAIQLDSRHIPLAHFLEIAKSFTRVSSGSQGGARPSGQVVFYADVANDVPGTQPSANVPRVRPNLVLLIEDGSSVLEKLHWSSWGGSAARATGILSASTCVPNCAQGKRTNDPVQFVVSQPRHLFGRTVYSCYQLTDPKASQTYHDCLKHFRGNQYYYSPVAGPAQAAGSRSVTRK